MADWFVGPVMEKLINTGFQYLHDQVRWQTGMKEELERLQEKHPKIQAVIFAASQAQFTDQNPALNKWLWQLRDVIDEAEDVLDDIEYVKHEQQLAKNKKKTKVRSTVSSMKKKLVKIGKRALKIDPNLKRLEEVVKKLDKVSADVGNFLHLLESTKQVQREQQLDLYKSRETGSLPKNNLIGRGKDMEFVMQWLRQPSDEEHQTPIAPTNLYSNISLLSIVGHGGMGKTTLLQHVYEDEITKEFDLKIWVCVSNNFDAKKVIADMLECLKKKRPCLEAISTLQEAIKSEMQFKKFLLVLDDIWDDDKERDKSKWENVLAPLAYGSLGSKILLTTRMDSVATMIANVVLKKKVTLKLNGLEEDECLQLLNTHAFANVETPGNHKKLNFITTEMVKKLSGSPLAAKVIGGVLNYSLDERHWITILNSVFRSVEFGYNDIFPILRLSYTFLPEHLRNCFAYCCIFPQDTRFDKNELVQKWIAVGFIQLHSNSRETIVDMGRRYFDILVRKSFLEKFLDGTYYKMHDLLHELAQSIFAQECFRFEGDEELFSRVSKSIRHLSIDTDNLQVLKSLTKFKNLHSLHVTCNRDSQDIVVALAEIFKASRSLRLLHIDSVLKEIPEEIGYLIHLRYLNIFGDITLLPKSLSKLYHLQFIIITSFNDSLSNNFLPKDFNNLSNLHYLDLPMDKFSEIHGIGKLISLEKMNALCVMNKDGHRIGELEHMNNLRSLKIKFLQDLNDATEACNAKLCDKRNLTNLSLDWARNGQNIVDSDLDERVLDTLQPPDNLKKLGIIDHMGFRSATWMNTAHLISNLVQIKLKKCLEWQTLPPFWQLPFLKFLYLEDMPKVKRIENDKDCGFPSLKVLHIEKLEALEDLFDAAAATADYCLFPCLTNLRLKGCPNLQELPYLPPKLEILAMDNIGWKTLSCCSISKSIPLKTLFVVGCPKIAYIPLADEIARFEALRKLEILDCPNLISLGGRQEVVTTENCQLQLSYISINDLSLLLMEPLRSITSLRNLEIKNNDELVSFPIEAEQWLLQDRSSLHNLTIERLKSLQALPSSLENLSSLKTLCLRDDPQLQLLPNFPTSLEALKIVNLESLQCLPSSLPTFSNLYSLTLKGIPLLKSLPNLPLSLKWLQIKKCQLADRYNKFSGSLENLSSLEILRLSDVPQLQLLPNIPTSLKHLELENLESLQCLPSSLPTFSNLHHLVLEGIPLLKSLPNLPPSLKSLSIFKCTHPELADRYKKFSGSDYQKIAHIPRLYNDL